MSVPKPLPNPAAQAAADAGLIRVGIKKLVNDQEVVARV